VLGDQESSDPRLADAERGGNRVKVNRLPLIPNAGMSGAPGDVRRGANFRSPKGDRDVAQDVSPGFTFPHYLESL